MGATPITGSSLGIGTYQYMLTFLTPGGETTPSAPITMITTSGNQASILTGLPIGPTLSNTTNSVIGRNIYRTSVGSSHFSLLTTIPDNHSTSYSDTLPDTALLTQFQPPGVNTSGIMLWPPLERTFAEYSNLFDSSTALAAGGNLGTQGIVGNGLGPTGSATPSFTLHLSNAELPKDTTAMMRVFYATRHQLDNNNSTIPEVHRDIIVLGSCLYAMEAYQIATNDNFEFQDGNLHDRIDDTKIPQAWLTAIQNQRQQFEARLQEVKLQRDFAYGALIRWGDVPIRWNRL